MHNVQEKTKLGSQNEKFGKNENFPMSILGIYLTQKWTECKVKWSVKRNYLNFYYSSHFFFENDPEIPNSQSKVLIMVEINEKTRLKSLSVSWAAQSFRIFSTFRSPVKIKTVLGNYHH